MPDGGAACGLPAGHLERGRHHFEALGQRQVRYACTMTIEPAFTDPRVQAVYEARPADVRERMLALRALVYEVAADLELDVQEALRWGEPAYLSRRGTTLRIDAKDPPSGRCQLFVHCQTELVRTFRERHPGVLETEGTRALHVELAKPLPLEPLRDFIAMALTYKLREAAERRRAP